MIQTTPLIDFPNEVLLNIMDYLDKGSRTKCLLVCHKFSLLADDWKTHFAHHFKVKTENLNKILALAATVFPGFKQINYCNFWEVRTFLGTHEFFARLKLEEHPFELISICLQSLKANGKNPDGKKLYQAIQKEDGVLVGAIMDSIDYKMAMWQEHFEDRRITINFVNYDLLIDFVCRDATIEIAKTFFQKLPYAHFALPYAFHYKRIEIIDFLADQTDKQINDGTLKEAHLYHNQWNLGIAHFLLRGPVRPSDEDFSENNEIPENVPGDEASPAVRADDEMDYGEESKQLTFGTYIKAIARESLPDNPTRLSFIHHQCIKITQNEWKGFYFKKW
jgi:hypothetical protein